MVFRHVKRLFHKHRYIGNAVFYSCLLSSADFVCQKMQSGVLAEHDFARTGRMAVLGCTYYGPFATFIYDNLDRVLPGTATKTVIKKMVFDQFVLTSFGVCVFYVGKEPLLFYPVPRGKEQCQAPKHWGHRNFVGTTPFFR